MIWYVFHPKTTLTYVDARTVPNDVPCHKESPEQFGDLDTIKISFADLSSSFYAALFHNSFCHIMHFLH